MIHLRLAIVDAEELERAAVKWMLKHGPVPARVVLESDSAEALTGGGGAPRLDALLIDPEHVRPEGSAGSAGYDLVRSLAATLPETLVVVMGYSRTASHVVGAVRAGAFDYLAKPVSQDDLVECLRRVEAACSGPRGAGSPWTDSQAYSQGELLYDLLFGNIDNLKEVWRRSRVAGLKELPNAVMVVAIDNFVTAAADRSEAWKRSLRRSILEVIRQTLEEVDPAPQAFVIGEDRVAVLVRVSAEPGAKEHLLKLASQIRDAVQGSSTVTVSVGIGNPHADPTNLHVSFQEAQKALGRKFFLGENVVVHVDEVSSTETEGRFVSARDPLPSLIARVRAKDREGAIRILDDVLEDLVATTRSAQAVKFAAADILLALVRVVFESGTYSAEALDQSADWLQAALKAGGAGELRQIMGGAIASIVDSVDPGSESSRLTVLRRVLDHINENYGRELTLTEVARTVWLSPAYLSHLFSKELGMGFVEYLTRVRVERAQTLLVGTSLSIGDIASEVGYRDASYFSRVFKAATGLSPTQYRLQSLKL